MLDINYVGGIERNGRLCYCWEAIDSPFHVRGLSFPACCYVSCSSFCGKGVSPSPVDIGLGHGRALVDECDWT